MTQRKSAEIICFAFIHQQIAARRPKRVACSGINNHSANAVLLDVRHSMKTLYLHLLACSMQLGGLPAICGGCKSMCKQAGMANMHLARHKLPTSMAVFTSRST